MRMYLNFALVLLLCYNRFAFCFTVQHTKGVVIVRHPSSSSLTEIDSKILSSLSYRHNERVCLRFPLFMGRAAAVRASTKAKTDGRKAKINAIFGKKIIMAVKEGGSADPNANRALYDVIKQAKANNVPLDNVNRAIKKATEGNAGDFKESTFEAYGFGGVSMVINVLTDNNNRASSDVRAVINKRDGKIAEPGSVLFMYDRKGKIEVNTNIDEDKVLEVAIDAECDDYELIPMDDGTTIIYTDPSKTAAMVDGIKSLLGSVEDDALKMSLVYVSKASVECSQEDYDKNLQIIDALEDLDDVDSVEHSMIL